MKNSVFYYQNYKRYLCDRIDSLPSKGHGFRSRLAQAAGCNVAYVSQVLNSSAHFSLEQAEEVNHLLGHNPEESLFFNLLVQIARAGTQRLKQRTQAQIDGIIQKRMNLKDRVDTKKTLSEMDQTRYYSSWYYAAIHILVSVPGLQTKEALAEHLGLSIEKVSSVLEFLLSISLVSQEQGLYKIGVGRVFLGNDSLMIAKHHANWRMKALEAIDNGDPKDVHFSTVMSLAKKDVALMREKLMKCIEETRAIVRDSKTDEEVHSLCLDFFEV